jgi:hypothetical protein
MIKIASPILKRIENLRKNMGLSEKKFLKILGMNRKLKKKLVNFRGNLIRD